MLAAHFFQHASVDWISVVDTLWLLGSTVRILRLHRIMMSSTSVDSTHAVEIQQISKQLEHILKQQDFIISVLEDLSSSRQDGVQGEVAEQATCGRGQRQSQRHGQAP